MEAVKRRASASTDDRVAHSVHHEPDDCRSGRCSMVRDKTKWEKITAQDLDEIKGDLATFGFVLHRRYGELQKLDVTTWANRRYSHWTGNYAGYKDAEPVL